MKITVRTKDGAEATIEIDMIENTSEELARFWMDQGTQVVAQMAMNLMRGSSPLFWPTLDPPRIIQNPAPTREGGSYGK